MATLIDVQSQCSAYDTGRKRCSLPTIENSNHCSLHHVSALKLYHNYKRICGFAFSLQLERDFENKDLKIQHLLKCYCWLNRAFNARMKHRLYAFVPECRDAGHDHQFERIRSEMLKCESLLEKQFQKVQADADSQEMILEEDNVVPILEDETLSFDNNGDGKKGNLMNLVKKVQKFRAEKEQEVELLLEKYKKEREDHFKNRKLIVTLIKRLIRQLFLPYIDLDEGENRVFYFLFIRIFQLLLKIHYFDNNFVPPRERGIVKRICSGPDFLDKDFMEEISIASEHTLKGLYEMILRYQPIIIPMVEDLSNLYISFGLPFDALFVWDKELKLFRLAKSKKNYKGKVDELIFA